MIFLIPAAYAAYRLGKAALKAPEGNRPEAMGRETVELAKDTYKVAKYAATIAGALAVSGIETAFKAVDKAQAKKADYGLLGHPSQDHPSQDGDGDWVERYVGSGEGGSGSDPGSYR